MCYMIILSTDSPYDLSSHNDGLVAFDRELPGIPEESSLTYPHRWFVGSAHGCSCGFRHLGKESVDLGFNEPETWLPEEPEDIEATIRLAGILRSLIKSGAAVEIIDAWANDSTIPNLSGTVHVNFTEISDTRFRFFENHRFLLRAEPNNSFQG